MKILMVTPYPPVRDGIAAYAVQSVARLRADGHDVEVLSPGPSAAHHHLDLVGPRGALALAKRVRRYDKVIVQFHPEVFFPVPATPARWRIESLAMFVAFRMARQVELRLHEIDYTRGGGNRALRFLNRLPWHAIDRIVVHTELERQAFATAFGVDLDRIVVAQHGADFRRCSDLSREQARATLGLPADDMIFLNIGFIQPHKGFDRCVRAVGNMVQAGMTSGYRLDIVGSLRTTDPVYVSHLAELRGLVDATPGAFLHEGYLSSELFDRWLVACDVVLLPYHSIWSSGVLERALLYDRRVIATDVGGLSFQTAGRELVSLVEGDDGLLQAMCELARAHTGTVVADRSDPPPSWAASVTVDREAIQREITDRAARRRRLVMSGPGWSENPASVLPPSAPLRAVLPVVLAEPASAWPGVRMVKRLLKRLLAGEFEPLVRQVNAMRCATIEALDAVGGDPTTHVPQPRLTAPSRLPNGRPN